MKATNTISNWFFMLGCWIVLSKPRKEIESRKAIRKAKTRRNSNINSPKLVHIIYSPMYFKC